MRQARDNQASTSTSTRTRDKDKGSQQLCGTSVRWDGAERSAGVRSTAGSKRGQQLPLGGSGCKADLGAGSREGPESGWLGRASA
jgi:hypothetical protein